MTKRVIYLCLMVIAVSAFASEKEVIPSTNVTPDFSLSTEQVETVQTGRRGRKSKRVKTPEQYVTKSFNNIFIGSTLFAYSIPTIPAGILGVYGCVIGIDNYIKLFKEPIFYKVMFNTFMYLVIAVPFLVIFPLFVAILINQKIRGITLYKILIYFPVIISIVVAAIAFKWLYANEGILNYLLSFFNIQLNTIEREEK